MPDDRDAEAPTDEVVTPAEPSPARPVEPPAGDDAWEPEERRPSDLESLAEPATATTFSGATPPEAAVAPIEPVAPAEPAEPTAPAEPIEPAQPAQPAAPAEPAESAESAESAEPASPSEPTTGHDQEVRASTAELAVAADEKPPVLTPEPAELQAPLGPLPIAAPELADQPAEELEEESAEVSDPPAASGTPRPVLAVLAFLLVALLLLTSWLTYQVVQTKGPAPVDASRSAAVEASRDAARLVFSYDYRHLAKDFAAAKATTTGSFTKEYVNTTSKLISDVAPPYKAVSVAEVIEVGVVEAARDRVVVLVFLNVESSSTLTSGPKLTPRRLKMTMQRQGDRWLVAKIDAF